MYSQNMCIFPFLPQDIERAHFSTIYNILIATHNNYFHFFVFLQFIMRFAKIFKHILRLFDTDKNNINHFSGLLFTCHRCFKHFKRHFNTFKQMYVRLYDTLNILRDILIQCFRILNTFRDFFKQRYRI